MEINSKYMGHVDQDSHSIHEYCYLDFSLNGSFDYNLDDALYWRSAERADVHASG